MEEQKEERKSVTSANPYDLSSKDPLLGVVDLFKTYCDKYRPIDSRTKHHVPLFKLIAFS